MNFKQELFYIVYLLLILLYFSDSVHIGTDIKIQGTISGRKKYSFLYRSATKKCNF